MSADTQLTREVEREKVEVVTETDEEYRCRECNQWFEDEAQIVPVQVGRGEAAQREQYCLVCAEGIFGYELEDEQRGLVWSAVDSLEYEPRAGGFPAKELIYMWLLLIGNILVFIFDLSGIVAGITTVPASIINTISSYPLIFLAGVMVSICFLQAHRVMNSIAD